MVGGCRIKCKGVYREVYLLYILHIEFINFIKTTTNYRIRFFHESLSILLQIHYFTVCHEFKYILLGKYSPHSLSTRPDPWPLIPYFRRLAVSTLLPWTWCWTLTSHPTTTPIYTALDEPAVLVSSAMIDHPWPWNPSLVVKRELHTNA